MISKKLSFLLLILFSHFDLFPQNSLGKTLTKPVIDSSAIKSWPTLGNGNAGQLISDDGDYFCYLIMNRPIGSQTAVLQSLKDSSMVEFPGAIPHFFTSTGKELVLALNDTLIRYMIASKKITKIDGALNVKYPTSNAGNWIAYQKEGQLSVLNCVNNKVISFSGVTDYFFDNSGRHLIIRTDSVRITDTITVLKLLNLSNNQIKSIWSGSQRSWALSSYSFNVDGKSVCFMIHHKTYQNRNEIWLYNERMNLAEKKVDDNSLGINPELRIADMPPVFSRNGRYVFFYLQNKGFPVKKEDYVSLDVWNYRDPVIQSAQLMNAGPKIYSSVIGVENNKVIQLESDSIKLKTYPDMTRGDYTVTMSDVGDQFWLDPYSNSNFIKYYIVSMIDGSQTELSLQGNNEFYFSPSGKYLVYFSSSGGKNYYYSVSLNTGKTINICESISPTLFTLSNVLSEYGSSPGDIMPPAGIASWFQNDEGVLVYDKNDIWKLDYATGKAPICITHNYGKKNKVKLWLLYARDNLGQEIPHLESESALLAAFNTQNCFNGFYRASFGKNADPHLLSMGPWTVFVNNGYLLPSNLTVFDPGIEPLKAKNANVWIVKRHTATDAPNYYYTKNFTDFKRITNIQPHTSYNWLQTEKVAFTQLDGVASSGVLYKPENFDPNKKYPVIIHYYQRFSERVYQYLPARFAASVINIPWFVSRGYLVFTPDIHFTKSKLGLSAYNAIEGAANWLCQQSYVNPNKIGINGHSLGGFKTDFVITRSSRFAAALSGAGISNNIEGALGLGGQDNGSRLEVTERRFGVPFYGNIDVYLENSPILKADQITTPLLLLHCKADYAVPWQHSVELFTALRRLQKPVWFLQYDDGNHILELEKDRIDYTIRITQFFDHYLKDYPMPKWMSKGIPAFKKGAESGYEYDGVSP